MIKKSMAILAVAVLMLTPVIFADMDADAADVQTSKNANGRALYHVVKLAGGGYVVTAGDTELPPVIAFSESFMTASQ